MNCETTDRNVRSPRAVCAHSNTTRIDQRIPVIMCLVEILTSIGISTGFSAGCSLTLCASLSCLSASGPPSSDAIRVEMTAPMIFSQFSQACCGACWRTRVCVGTFGGGDCTSHTTQSLSSLCLAASIPGGVTDSHLPFTILRPLFLAGSVCPEPRSSTVRRSSNTSVNKTVVLCIV